jgi:hypothetical protein
MNIFVVVIQRNIIYFKWVQIKVESKLYNELGGDPVEHSSRVVTSLSHTNEILRNQQ